jgi:hypothetical protein
MAWDENPLQSMKSPHFHLNDDELALAARLEYLVKNDKIREAQSLLGEVFPRYWKDESTSLYPVSIYRTIYYLHLASDYVDDTRHLIENMGQHLEGLLNQMVRKKGKSVKMELGRKIEMFRTELGDTLRRGLYDFDDAIHNVAKHPDDDPQLPVRFDVRRFSTKETLLSLTITRHFSIQLFLVLDKNGIQLPQSWPQFNSEWLSWDRVTALPPPVLSRAERVPSHGRMSRETEEDATE